MKIDVIDLCIIQKRVLASISVSERVVCVCVRESTTAQVHVPLNLYMVSEQEKL